MCTSECQRTGGRLGLLFNAAGVRDASEANPLPLSQIHHHYRGVAVSPVWFLSCFVAISKEKYYINVFN